MRRLRRAVKPIALSLGLAFASALGPAEAAQDAPPQFAEAIEKIETVVEKLDEHIATIDDGLYDRPDDQELLALKQTLEGHRDELLVKLEEIRELTASSEND